MAFSEAQANGSFPEGGRDVKPGRKTVQVTGTYGGASVALKLSPDGTTFQTVHTFSAAAPEPKSIDYTGGKLQFEVSNGSASTDLEFWVT